VAGDPSNATLWPEADVFTAPLGSALPATVDDAFPAAWDLVGLLDGAAGFVHHREEEGGDLFAWGGILVRRARRNFKAQVTFTALEDNEVVRELVWPGSSDTSIVVPHPDRILIAFETREDETVKRLISSYQAEVDVASDIVDKEDDLTKNELIATIFPLASVSPPELFVRQATVVGS
jgi:hypothetical protein